MLCRQHYVDSGFRIKTERAIRQSTIEENWNTWLSAKGATQGLSYTLGMAK